MPTDEPENGPPGPQLGLQLRFSWVAAPLLPHFVGEGVQALKPIAFRIWDFKSIVDSGECELSADNITVLAGQNESGKTAILQALRDFDLEKGERPQTQDYTPDGKFDAKPRVAVKLAVGRGDLEYLYSEENLTLPKAVEDRIIQDGGLWITRDLPTGMFELEAPLRQAWELSEVPAAPASDVPPPETGAAGGTAAEPQASPATFGLPEFAASLRLYWPSFVYFDSFEDTLPRTVDFSVIESAAQATKKKPKATVGTSVPRPVQDYITLSEIDTDIIQKFATEDKALSDYLSNRSAQITGDFLTYWKQTSGEEQSVTLRVKH